MELGILTVVGTNNYLSPQGTARSPQPYLPATPLQHQSEDLELNTFSQAPLPVPAKMPPASTSQSPQHSPSDRYPLHRTLSSPNLSPVIDPSPFPERTPSSLPPLSPISPKPSFPVIWAPQSTPTTSPFELDKSVSFHLPLELHTPLQINSNRAARRVFDENKTQEEKPTKEDQQKSNKAAVHHPKKDTQPLTQDSKRRNSISKFSWEAEEIKNCLTPPTGPIKRRTVLELCQQANKGTMNSTGKSKEPNPKK